MAKKKTKKVFRMWKYILTVKDDMDYAKSMANSFKIGWPQKSEGKTKEEARAISRKKSK